MKKSLLTLLFSFILGSTVEAQEITGFKTETFTNEYGNYRLKIIPNTFDATKPKITKTSGVYGVRICYTQNGVQKSSSSRHDLQNSKQWSLRIWRLGFW